MRARASHLGWLLAASALFAPLALAQGAAPGALSAASPRTSAPLPGPASTRASGEIAAGARERAKQLFEKGVAAYAAQRYYEAIEIFAATDRLYPNPQIAFNIAKAYDALGSRTGGLQYYRDYLRRSPEASDRAQIELRVRELETLLAEGGVQQISVLSDPPAALVFLDEQPVGLTPWTGHTWPGKHRIELRRANYETDTSVAEVEAHRSSELNVVLRPTAVAPPAKSAAQPSSRAAAAHASRLNLLTWTALATGGAALGTAVVIESTGSDSSGSVRPGTAFFAGLGAAASVVGGVLLYFRASDQRAESGRSSLAFKVTPGSCAARITTHF
jgi:tetratricopeptide (TPR) repeat protein